MKETIEQAGYKHIAIIDGKHLLQDKTNGRYEVFQTSRNFAGWALVYKNTHLEYCHAATADELKLFGVKEAI